jgi:Magnesium chelatase, subunit ChlI
VLESRRQPLEDGVVAVARVAGHALFSVHFQLVGTINLCFRRPLLLDPRRRDLARQPSVLWAGLGASFAAGLYARDTRAMRVRAVVSLAAMTLLFAGWTQSPDNTAWNSRGKAVLKTPDGVSHVIRHSVCNFGPRTGRLRFGGTAISSDSPYMSLVVRALKGNPTALDIEDGVLRLAPDSTFAVVLA